MDFRFTQEEETFRQELQEFMRKELPPERMAERAAMQTGSEAAWEFGLDVSRKLAQKGWLLGAWPREYGGEGWSFTRQLIFNEEMSYHGAPRGDIIGRQIAGPAIISHGTEEQKKRHLHHIARCERIWCQGFSEPEAGSDLASLQTRAVGKGDDFVLNGQKVWTTQAQHSDWGIFLARTDPNAKKHKGISYFLLDMKTPGVEVRPVPAMGLGSHYCEVFLDDVLVPKDCILGGPEMMNQGWQQVTKTFEFERSGISGLTSAKRLLEELVSYAKETRRNGEPLAADPLVRQRFAELAAEIEVGRMLSYQVSWLQSKGLGTTYEPSRGKAYSSELTQRLSNFGMRLLGLYGQMEKGSKWAVLRGRIENTYMVAMSNTVGGGTTEIQRNVMAIRGLGLPLGSR